MGLFYLQNQSLKQLHPIFNIFIFIINVVLTLN